ncbi:MAG: VOC family protein [Intrasporangium sp.]|uniref:VOC family protein n=1 Tax=Intrasporangium sp. TaxID=1925024 RepID=UPI0026476E22|nr:VOC family protein [Intrasporangium sp.]MDN5795027.1 VOC family protein [Intrasporangium sp.]
MSEPTSGAKLSFGNIAFDCRDPVGLAGFYAGLLGGEIDADTEGDWVSLHWDGPDLAFQHAPDHEPPQWHGGGQQAHIDFMVADVRGAHTRILELGGRALDPTTDPRPGHEGGFRIYADPAGHPFCLCRPSPDAWR